MTDREKRSLQVLAGAVVVAGAIWIFTGPSNPTKVVAAVDTVEHAEKRLELVRQAAATVQGKEQTLGQLTDELGRREKGLIIADTAPQAQAQLVQIIKRVAKNEGLDIRQVDLGRPALFAEAYGEVAVAVTVDAHIEQLVNLMADLTAEPEIVATSDMRVSNTNPKLKTMAVRLTVSGIIPKKLVPEKKGMLAF